MGSKLLNRVIIVLFLCSIFIVGAVTTYSVTVLPEVATILEQDIEDRMLTVSHGASKILTAEDLDQFQVPEDMQKPEYDATKEILVNFAEDFNILFVYYYRLTPDGMLQPIIDNDFTEDTYNLDTPPLEMEAGPERAFSGEFVTPGIGNYSVGFEGLLSAYAPVFDDDGDVVAIAGVDITDEIVVNEHQLLQTFTILLVISVIFVAVTGILALLFQFKREKYLINIDKERIAAMETAVLASEAKGSFLSSMSHEMRTPMNAIIGMTTIGHEADGIEKKDYCFEKITDASTQLLGIINDVLDMSKIEANKLEISRTSFSFDKMIERIVDVMNFKFNEKNQKFVVEIDPDIPKYLYSDDLRIGQVINNLLSNAYKFTPENGTVTLQAVLESRRGNQNTIKISITDTGIGLNPEQQSRLFRSFEQASTGTAREYGGTGLGLAISKSIVELLGGKIWVDSEPGKGSVFAFRFVAESGEDLSAENSSEQNESFDFSKVNLLLAEDIDINREIIIGMLEETHINIEIAEDGQQALELFSARPEHFDVILMDIQMPNMDGYEATRSIRALDVKKAQEIAIIAMTANVFREDIEKSLAAGMNDHISKPVDLETLLHKLAKYLGT